MHTWNYNSNYTCILMSLNFAFSQLGERSASELKKNQLSIHLRSEGQIEHHKLLRTERRTDNTAVSLTPLWQSNVSNIAYSSGDLVTRRI